jgi:hypothetical protein
MLGKLGMACPCKRRCKSIIDKRKVNNEGWDRVQEDIDLVNIVKELRTLRFLTKFLLTKH